LSGTRLQLAMSLDPLDMAKGLTLRMVKAIMRGRGNEIG
jgi:hypothetical protein